MKHTGIFLLPQGLCAAEIELEYLPPKSLKISKINILEKIQHYSPLRYPKIVFPSFIDLHVHCRDDQSHSNSYKEDHYTASLAAERGGVGAIADMPNTPCPPTTEDGYRQKLQLISSCGLPILCYGAIGSSTRPFACKVPYKFFIGSTTGASGDIRKEVLENYRGQWVSMHCEDEAYFSSSSIHYEKRNELSEVKAIEKAIEWAISYGLRLNICHVSTKRGMQLIQAAKRNGVDLSCEVTFHHLLANCDNEGKDFRFQVNPPLRKQKDCDYLLESLEDGSIDYLVTDHAPHLYSEKQMGISGIPMLELYGAMVGELIATRGIHPEAIYRAGCENPGKVFYEFTGKRMERV